MKSVDGNIGTLERAILIEAKDEAEEIRAEAMQKAEAIRQRTQEQVEAARKQILERAHEEAERLRSQALATTQLKARKMQLEHRETLLDRVFNAVRQQLPEVQQSKDYDQIAFSLLSEALTQLMATNAVIRADERTLRLFTRGVLDDISKGMKANLQLGQPLQKGIGVIVETSDRHLQYDNTLETRLNRMQSGLRSTVYRILMGESI
jgi:vacuolar-type H+-ATPase subunit E/Vma4